MSPRQFALLLLAVLAAALPGAAEPDYTAYLIPNTHGTIAGWLVNFDTERSYVLNNHLNHLDRIAADKSYKLAISEVPNLMALLKFAPDRVEVLKRLVKERRVEFVNGFFLEPTVNLSGGEALAQMSVLGLRWYQDVFGVRPRFAWMIDVCGMHGQMPQIVALSGLEGLFFSRNNPMPKDAFWWVAPDGTRTLAMALGPGYAAGRTLFNTAEPLSPKQMGELASAFDKGRAFAASPRHLLMVAGGGDYSLAPTRSSYPAEFLEAWRKSHPGVTVKMATPGEYVDKLQEEIRSGRTKLDEYRGDAAYSYNAFWMNMPEVKRDYRQSEHLLQTAEMVASAASLLKGRDYPAQGFYDAWIQMLVNMDRNVLWGAGSGSPFYDSHHWNVWDRFESVKRTAGTAWKDSVTALSTGGQAVTLFNPLNWDRSDPVEMTLPPGSRLAGLECQATPGSDDVLCLSDLPAASLSSRDLVSGPYPSATLEPLEAEITGGFYLVRIDRETGSVLSIRDRRSGKEYVGGPANVVLAESVEGVVKDPTNWMAPRPMRKLVDSTQRHKADVQVFRGPLAVTIVARSGFLEGSRIERRITLYNTHPRIDFETTIDLHARNVVVTADFPLAGTVTERTRGIPFGFSVVDPRVRMAPNEYFLMADHRTYGFSDAIEPAVRWSDYAMEGGGGMALLDRGLTSHELNGNTVTLALVNAQDYYRGLDNMMLTGQGTRTFHYALWPHGGDWRDEEIPKRAWEFNSPLMPIDGRKLEQPLSILSTSPNVIVEALRRIGPDIEVRLVEWAGREGNVEVTLKLPHHDARLTNLMGEKPEPLTLKAGAYRFPVRPQQVITLRFRTDSEVPQPAAIRDWAPLVPRFKRAPLETKEPVRGYPAITRQPTSDDFGAKPGR